MKISWLILALQFLLFIEGLFLIALGLLNIPYSFTPARISVALGVILINVAAVLTFLHRKLNKTKMPIQPTLASPQQVLCTLCGKRNVVKADFCSICGQKLDVKGMFNQYR